MGTGPGVRFDEVAKRTIDVLASAALLAVLSPLVVALAIAVKLESRGRVFYGCRRVGLGGREFAMLKFRKMRSDASGPALTAVEDARFTRMGAFLAKTKLDEIPQLWNVLRGQMSLVGPRPEDPGFVELHREEFEQILRVRPGITGLSQLAFAKEMEILDPNDRVGDYVRRLLPAKMRLDELYVARRSLRMYVRILWWTAVTVVLGHDVAVSRQTGRLNLRRRPRPVRSEAAQMGGVAS